ncbi:MAG: hypothetical protein K2N74_03745, partial [Clostridiales bacterium]|nr:hypothetical protein [Clostridiales bacterium]
YYVNYTDLFANTTLYDEYSREETERYDVFVGEYSANSYTSGGASYAADSEWANSWITAISEAAVMTGYERNGDVVKLAAYAPMFAPIAANHRQWNVDMMYFTNTQLVLSTNYYVQQLFMKNSGNYMLQKSLLTFADGFEQTREIPYVSSPGATAQSRTIDKIYYVASLAENGDIIIKVVNAGEEAVKMNFNISNAKGTGIAHVTELASSDWKAKNSLTETKISPESYTIGNGSMKEFGHEIKPYSVTAIRVHTK